MVGQRKPRGAKAKACPKDSSIKKALRVTCKSPSKKPEDDLRPEQVTKGHQSGFLMFCKAAKGAHDQEVREQAESVLMEYKSLSRDAKKHMVSAFFRSGGKRGGLKNVYSQKVQHKSLAHTGSWEGWLTPGGIFKLQGVPGERNARWKPHVTREGTWKQRERKQGHP